MTDLETIHDEMRRIGEDATGETADELDYVREQFSGSSNAT
ncbi:hypothetical protein [Halorussus lipolyticus]|nr:hypothetical protein [Halorussus sp. DT80]